MVLGRIALGAAAATMFLAGAALAEGHIDGAIKARKAHMGLNGFNLGILGGMAQGKTDYDAEAASKAAANLAALTRMDQSAYWPQGSDNSAAENTRALPVLWENFSEAVPRIQAVADAAAAMETAAGVDLASLQGAMGALGGACGACHKAYRAPN